MVAQKDKDNWRYLQGKFYIQLQYKPASNTRLSFPKSSIFVKTSSCRYTDAFKNLLARDGSKILNFSNIPLFCILPHMTHFCFWSCCILERFSRASNEDLKGSETIKGQYGYSIYVILHSSSVFINIKTEYC